ncbi:Transcription elongation factor B Polypeptide 3 [Daphnia magna]|uniref:Transcription elongation factor B Polypeptide 3 n=1 Tax=Daphnia magna TaxID=35525 RepID=A0A164Y5X4_9CRUS|nr:Transcription elongation factor B Polypeptide 3 [Daphnia magna]
MSSTNEEILHYQRKILKYGSDSKVMLHCLNKLTKLPIGVEHLQATGIGRTINGMRKAEGAVGEEARSLVSKWKEIVAAEDKSDSDHQEEESSHHNLEATSDNLNMSPNQHKKDKDVKKKESHKDKSKDDPIPSLKSKSSSSKEKSPEKHTSKSNKVSEKHRDSKEGESSKSSSRSSRKRHHSQEDSNSNADDEDGDETPTQSFADALERKNSSFLPPPIPESSIVSKPILAPPKSLDIRPTDFEISPHYKPLPLKFVADPLPSLKDRARSSEEALTSALSFSQKGNRTKVFSGNRSSGLAYVPSLFDCCIRVLQQNIDALEYTGGVPYELIRPVLERANSQQLFSLEDHNAYLLEDTDELWKVLCQKEYRKAVREEMETWRDLYVRCHEEREARLKSLTSNHKQSMAKATPQRTTKLAFVESLAKAPRGKLGPVKPGSSAVLASMTNAKSGARPFEASANHAANGSTSVAEVVKMTQSSAPRSSSSSSSSAAKKPKVAPLMQKTLKALKNRYRR